MFAIDSSAQTSILADIVGNSGAEEAKLWSLMPFALASVLGMEDILLYGAFGVIRAPMMSIWESAHY